MTERDNDTLPHANMSGSWWAAYALPGIPQASFYTAAKREDEQRFSRQPREVPVFTDQRFGAIKPSRTNVEAD